MAANPVAWLIPCHNVLRQDGALGGYHWGADRKRAMLAWSALREAAPARASQGPRRRARAGDIICAPGRPQGRPPSRGCALTTACNTK